MIEGVHIHGLEALLRRPSVPTLPHGGGSHLNGEQPRGISLLLEQAVGQVITPGDVQRLKEAGRADESGGKVVVETSDLVREFGGGLLLQVVRNKPHREGKDIAGLAATTQGAVGIKESGEGLLELVMKLGVFRLGLCVPNGMCHLGHELRIVGIIGRIHDFWGGTAPFVQPITEVVAFKLPGGVLRLGGEPIHETLHRGIVITNHGGVVVGEPDLIGNDDGRICPCRCSTASQHIGSNIRNGSVGMLGVLAQGCQPLGEEGVDVEVVGGGGDEEFSISCPPCTFVALRAVRRNVEVVRFLSPDNIVVELVQDGTGALEGSRPFHGSVDNHACYHGRFRFLREAPDLDIAESMEGGKRFERLLACAGQRKAICRGGAAQIGRVERAIRVEKFTIPDDELLSGASLQLQTRPTAHVLSEIEDCYPWGGLGDLHGRQ